MSGCPCGSGAALDACCGPLLAGVRQAATPEELMRSRYTAYATGDENYVFRTWHPRTRPRKVALEGVQWVGLDVVEAAGSEVEFVARFLMKGRRNLLHERSRFEQRAGRWFYVDGDVS